MAAAGRWPPGWVSLPARAIRGPGGRSWPPGVAALVGVNVSTDPAGLAGGRYAVEVGRTDAGGDLNRCPWFLAPGVAAAGRWPPGWVSLPARAIRGPGGRSWPPGVAALVGVNVSTDPAGLAGGRYAVEVGIACFTQKIACFTLS